MILIIVQRELLAWFWTASMSSINGRLCRSSLFIATEDAIHAGHRGSSRNPLAEPRQPGSPKIQKTKRLGDVVVVERSDTLRDAFVVDALLVPKGVSRETAEDPLLTITSKDPQGLFFIANCLCLLHVPHRVTSL